ncbi:hypothetical protein BABINDRAFT_13012 [Babjeviella inositovora NRRL Y-12698]|uniref:Glucosidase 2 subunit beta n=1 Tax=Babjeviella inositovora NRRL Y-12698 TaxID=984486 RepID=A0A1E3QSW7_9ASCO|nr:uncharacterized protein BABINDRAFT_13012 [Babjeviella inositovora NRRL Y-12698]ODQ80112.1 hypothetical protein BABINDRAFT_13012 [Babjeviella inositovora NRRL Y-12698]
MKLASIVTVASATSFASATILGVSPEDQHKYQPDANNQWRCLGNPEIILTYDQINDDFCDCPDGSDEPGTAACASILRSPTRFYCANVGHIPRYIENHKVNDGVCDYELCCDGSDEWQGVGGVQCPNKCAEIHEKYVATKEWREAALSLGLVEKSKLVQTAADKKARGTKEVAKLRTEMAQKASRLDELEEQYRQAQSNIKAVYNNAVSERMSLVKGEYAAQQERMSVVSQQAAYLEEILAKLIENYNPNFNDLSVKEAVQNFQDYTVNKDTSFQAEPVDLHLMDVLEESLKEIDIEQPAKSLSLVGYIHNVYRDFVTSFLGTPNGGQETMVVMPDTQEIEAVKKDIASAELKISSHLKEYEGESFGEDGILHALSEKCITNKVGEYDYDLCFTGSIHQKGHGSNVAIGTFDRVVYETNNETSEKEMKIFYEDGAQCWNGPRRRGVVSVTCSNEFEIVSVTEPEKCEYHFNVKSPLGCFEEQLAMIGEKIDVGKIAHDEL